ncbi:MAG TPA: di-heme oxidoredictase family protein [Gemmatimonadales bacterium]|nr:di-heme oxidoredictase family protein [Gemmatimonadales bacterium]
MTRVTVLVVLVALTCAAAACTKPLKPGDPLRGLSAAERARFDSGRVVFESTFTAEVGLGPLFNASGCAECHEDPVVGAVGDEVERHAAIFHAERPEFPCDLLAPQGGPVFQDSVTPALRAALGIDREELPPGVSTVAARTTPDVLGFGLLDAVSDSTILASADPDDRNGDGISGRPNRFFDGRIGRFGRKALVPALRDFNDGAFQIESGVTNPSVPDEGTVTGRPFPAGTDPAPDPELNERSLVLTDAFVRMLAPPAPLKQSGAARQGQDVFNRAGCAACHVPVLRTGDNPIAALRHKDVAAYTDLLLHDMGEGLADICFGLATPSEFRTEPLMGLRLATQFLHDGRAKTPEEAIDLHGGEAARSRDLFRALSAADQAALIAFLKTL